MDLKTIAGWIDDLAKSSGKTLSALFQQWDENGDGYIDYEEFVVCCMTTQNKVSNSGNLDVRPPPHERIPPARIPPARRTHAHARARTRAVP
jgi:hypothetical protein